MGTESNQPQAAVACTKGFLPAEIKKRIETAFLGRWIHHFDELAFTNMRAK